MGHDKNLSMGLRLRPEIFVTPVAVHPLTNLISKFWSLTRGKHEGNDRRRFPWKDVLEVRPGCGLV